MKTVNADHGYGIVPAEKSKRTWYRWYRFPLVPIVSYRPADEWNANDLSFSWLWLRLWTLDSFSEFRAEIAINAQGISVGLILPYLRVWINLLPLPDRFENWTYRSRWYRRGTMELQ